MQPFEYCRVRDVAEAVALLRDGSDSKLLAGGQSLLASMKLGLHAPARLIDLGRVPSLQGTRALPDGRLWVGAMQTHGALARDAALQAHAPGLAQLAAHVADPQVRQRGTVGGSVSNADPAACWPAGLLAAGAQFQTDRRTIAADDFFTGLFGTALEPDEVLCGLALPRPRRLAYLKIEQPASRFALVGVAVAKFDDGVRVAVTGSGSGAVRLPAFEQALARHFAPQSVAGLHVEADLMSSDLHAQADYRAHLAAVLVRRAVQAALQETPA